MKNNLIKNFSVLSIISMMVLSPVFAFADRGGKNKTETKKQEKQERLEKQERKENKERDFDDDDHKEDQKKCWVAYGHLISFGWLKKNNPINIDADCYLPFGIAKKIRSNSTSTTTVDTTAPIISNLSTSTDLTKATITWNTNEKSDSTVFWSTTPSVNIQSSSTANISLSGKTKYHKIVINNLSTSTTYYAIIRSRDSSGNSTTSPEFSFTTKTPAIVVDTVPPTIFSIVSVVGTSTANVGWQTNEPATSKIYYSTTTPLNKNASSTVSLSSQNLSNVHLFNLQNLATSTTYHVIVESKDATLNTQTSPQFSFTTASGI